MLAAPKNYKFGTKIYLEGLGVGSVEDRGGAIVNAGNRWYKNDRIDVWVGTGDEGLRRALYWGKRKVKGHIVGEQKTSLNYAVIWDPSWATNSLQQVPAIFNVSLGIGSDTNQVKNLQKLLQELGKYKGEINGEFNEELIKIIHNFMTFIKFLDIY